MFTGIVEEIGIIQTLSPYPNGLKVSISARKVLEGVQLGDSIAVNGVCVTVTEFTDTSFTVDIMLETVRKTLWQFAASGDRVHLERAMTLSKPLGGHIVTGHVNGIGEIIDIKRETLHTVVTVQPPAKLLRYMVDQGSVAINGVSLTIVEVTDKYFTVSLVPHTISATTILDAKKVNLEVDILAKYVEKMLRPETAEEKKDELTVESLMEAGFY